MLLWPRSLARALTGSRRTATSTVVAAAMAAPGGNGGGVGADAHLQPHPQPPPLADVPPLDRAAFTRVTTVPALRVPKQRCSELMRAFKGFTLDRPRTRCVVHDEEGGDEDTRLLLLREDLAGSLPDGAD